MGAKPPALTALLTERTGRAKASEQRLRRAAQSHTLSLHSRNTGNKRKEMDVDQVTSGAQAAPVSAERELAPLVFVTHSVQSESGRLQARPNRELSSGAQSLQSTGCGPRHFPRCAGAAAGMMIWTGRADPVLAPSASKR